MGDTVINGKIIHDTYACNEALWSTFTTRAMQHIPTPSSKLQYGTKPHKLFMLPLQPVNLWHALPVSGAEVDPEPFRTEMHRMNMSYWQALKALV